MRCGYTVVPKELNGFTLEGERFSLTSYGIVASVPNLMVQITLPNGLQKLYTHLKRKEQVKEIINYYMTNARIMKEAIPAVRSQSIWW